MNNTQMITFTINDQEVTVPKGTTVYNAARQLGIDIPIFCYHDRMPPFGACRMCLVEVEKMPKLQTSCTLEATQGMVVRTQTEKAVKSREGILEFLLINHPLDCPICDRGGECPLQDQVVKFGPGLSRFFEDKRRFKKPLPLGPVLMLDRERCIICARCTRFGDLVAGDHALEFLDRGFKTEVGTPDGGPAQSKFIGNTIEMCPVGALTSQVYRFRARPWDNDSTNSTCTLCPVGCSMILDSRDGEIMRTRSRENKNVNDIWMCDKGYFGYEFSYSEERIQQPLIRKNGNLVLASWDEAFTLIAKQLISSRQEGKIAALGGDALTFEDNYLYQQLIRIGAGVNHIDHRVGTPIINVKDEGLAPGMEMSIGDTESLSYAFLLGLDITEEFPVIWLRLKQAINRGAKVVFVGHYAPEIADHLSATILHSPGKELETLQQYLKPLSSGSKGALFVGRQYLATKKRHDILSYLLEIQNSTPNLALNIMEGHGNSMGARLAGMRPDIGPFGKKLDAPGMDTVQILESASRNGWDFLYVAGANPAAKFSDSLWNRSGLKFLVVQDLFLTHTARQADVVLPALSYVEKEGHFINIAGEAQKLNPGKRIPEGLYSDGQIFKKIAQKLDIELEEWTSKIEVVRDKNQNATPKGANQENDTGLRASFVPVLFDKGIRMQHNSHLIQLAKEPYVRIHSKEGSARKIKEDDKVFLRANGNTIEGTIRLDDRVSEGTVVLPIGFPALPVQHLDPNLFNGISIDVGKK